jgi:hypothetical protein
MDNKTLAFVLMDLASGLCNKFAFPNPCEEYLNSMGST